MLVMPGHVLKYEVFPYGSTVVNYRWPAWSVLPALKSFELLKNFRTPVELLILKCLPSRVSTRWLHLSLGLCLESSESVSDGLHLHWNLNLTSRLPPSICLASAG